MGVFVEWRIENFSHWCMIVHDGRCIKSPIFNYYHQRFMYMQLYPKGTSGLGEHLEVHLGFCYSNNTFIPFPFSGELSLYSSDGSSLCFKQQVNNAERNRRVLELPPGPKFEDVLSRIRESEDFIIVELRVKNSYQDVKRVCTTINVLKISLDINPKWIGNMKSNETKDVFYILLTPDDNLGRMWLEIRSKDNAVQFTITPPFAECLPFAVEMCLSLTRSDGNVDNGVKKEHVFLDDSPWTFPDSLEKGELEGKGLSLFLCVKTRNLIQSPIYVSCAYSCVSIESKNKICFPEKVLTKDSGSQTSLASGMAAYSVLVLSKELMCLYQDQDLSDITLKCDNVTFPVHRAILSARSPVFKTMLSTDMKEAASGEVDIGDLDPSTLGLFLTYLYTGAVEEDPQCDSALKLYYAADKYQVPSLKKDCSKFLCANLSISNVCDILSLADKHRDDELTTVSHNFILNNFSAVLGSKEWDTLKKKEPLLAVNTLTLFGVEGRVRKHHPL